MTEVLFSVILGRHYIIMIIGIKDIEINHQI